MQQFHAAMRAIAFRHVLNGCDKCFGGFDKHFDGFDKHSGGFDKHFVRFDEHLARIFDVLTTFQLLQTIPLPPAVWGAKTSKIQCPRTSLFSRFEA